MVYKIFVLKSLKKKKLTECACSINLHSNQRKIMICFSCIFIRINQVIEELMYSMKRTRYLYYWAKIENNRSVSFMRDKHLFRWWFVKYFSGNNPFSLWYFHVCFLLLHQQWYDMAIALAICASTQFHQTLSIVRMWCVCVCIYGMSKFLNYTKTNQ